MFCRIADGSDEYFSNTCGDRCLEIAAEANREITERIEKVKLALAAKKAMGEQAAAKRLEQEAQMAVLKDKLDALAPEFSKLEGDGKTFRSAELARQAKDTASLATLAREAGAAEAAAETEDGPTEAAAEEAVEVAPCDWNAEFKGVQGELVEANYQDLDNWLNASILLAHEDGTFDVEYAEDKETENNLPAERVRCECQRPCIALPSQGLTNEGRANDAIKVDPLSLFGSLAALIPQAKGDGA
eukprot:SAG11_NODE_2046_length_3884_cov_2.228005_3_plen_244_part_00